MIFPGSNPRFLQSVGRMFEANTGFGESIQSFLHAFAYGQLITLHVDLDERNILEIASFNERVPPS